MPSGRRDTGELPEVPSEPVVSGVKTGNPAEWSSAALATDVPSLLGMGREISSFV